MRCTLKSVVLVIIVGLLVGLYRPYQAVHSQGGVQRALPPGSAPRPPDEDAYEDANEEPDQILLRSRQFAPAAGVEPGLAESIEATPGRQDGRAHVLLQLHRVPNTSDLAALEAASIQLLNYIPRNGWFGSLPAEDVEGTLARTGVATVVWWVGQILPEDKVPARVRAGEFGTWAVADDGRVRLAVSFFDDVSLETARQVVAGHGAEIEGESGLLNQLKLLVGADVVSALAAEDTVRWVDQIAPPYVTQNDGARRATRVDEVQALPHGLSGKGVTVGIWDGGAVEASHDDFEDQSGSSRVTARDAVGVSDHSTHVGGTVAGNGARSATLGGTDRQWRGMAPQAEIVSYDYKGNLDDEHAEAIASYGIDLSQNSWGYGVDESEYNNCYLYGDYTTESRMFDLIVRGQEGRRIPVVFGAGNERNDKDCGMDPNPPYGSLSNYANLLTPGTAKNVINVGASNSHDDSMTLFSSWGPADDGRLVPQVVAPGCEENPDRVDTVYTQTMWSTQPGNGYGGMCGTSMAAPVVSGIGALLIEQHERTYGAAPLPSTIKALLVHGAVDMDDGTSWYNTGPDFASGYGRVDAVASVDLIVSRALREDVISADDETDVFTISVGLGTTKLKVTLAWDDPAAIENANPTLINDLDLVVRAPSMAVHDPWVLNPGSPSANATRGVDRINNLEQVLVDSPAAGTWTISVEGDHVPQAPQKYSLVSELLASGDVYLPLVLRSYSGGPGPGEWTIILEEGFEGSFPGPWELLAGDYLWAKSDCRSDTGSSSAWAIGGGPLGSALSCGASYPISTTTWLVYGPFDLSDATDAEMIFRVWQNTSADDIFAFLASVPDSKWHGWGGDVPTDWLTVNFDLTDVPTLGDLTGEPQVWIAFIFVTDDSGTAREGAYVDNVVIRKCTHPTCVETASAAGPPAGMEWVVVPATAVRAR